MTRNDEYLLFGALRRVQVITVKKEPDVSGPLRRVVERGEDRVDEKLGQLGYRRFTIQVIGNEWHIIDHRMSDRGIRKPGTFRFFDTEIEAKERCQRLNSDWINNTRHRDEFLPHLISRKMYASQGQRYGRYKKLGDAYKEALGLGWKPDKDNEGVFVGYVTVETDDGAVTYEQRLMAQELGGEWFLRVIDESDLIKRGGPGSGHHGHRGRVGETGGSEPGKGAPHYKPGAGAPRGYGAPQAAGGRAPAAAAAGTAQTTLADVAPDDSATVAQYSHTQAQQSEPELTGMMESLAEATEGRLEGLEFSVKEVDRLQEKIERDMKEKGISAQEAASEINDRNRYTIVLGSEEFVVRVAQVQAELEGQGWTEYDQKYKNFFGGGDTYDGYNTVVVHESGQRFELQFHTEGTIAAKEQIHPLYQRFQITIDRTERREIYREMADAYTGVERPEGWEQLPGQQVYQEEPE